MPFDFQKLKQLRKDAGITQASAAEAAGLGRQSQWADIEDGRHPNPTLGLLESVARVVKCDPCELISKRKK